MPLAKIHIRKGHRAEKKRAIADAVQASLIATLEINDRQPPRGQADSVVHE